MKKHIGAVATAAALAISGLVTPAGPASAADNPCTILGFTPTTVVVGLSPITRSFNVQTSGCTKAGWGLILGDYAAVLSDGAAQDTFEPFSNSDAGAYSAIAIADNADGVERQRSWASGFFLKRKGSWGTFNAGPEPVKATKPITIQGRLSRANWSTHRYDAHPRQIVRVQFRTPTGTYATVKTIKTDAAGWAKTTVTASRTGYWRFVFDGYSTSGPVTSWADRVQVN
jgi:hypothetical protein